MTGPVHDQRYAPPQAHVEDVAVAADGFVLARRGPRLGAALIDVLLLAFGWWLVAALFGWNPGAPLDGQRWLGVAADFAFSYGLFLAVNGYLLVNRGQTIGKLALGLRIVRPDGSRAAAARLLGLRYGLAYYALTMIPGFGQAYALVDALSIFQPSRRCLHDLIAGTIVVQA